MKFVHIASFRDANAFNVPHTPTGYYHWHKAFGGEFRTVHEVRPHEYDIVFVGMTAPECAAMRVSRIKEQMRSDAKLVVCLDHAAELIQANFDFEVLRHELRSADLCFAAEPIQASCLSALIGKEVPVIHHPVDVEWLRSVKPEKLLDWIAVFVHRYDNHWGHGYLVTRGLPWTTTGVFMDRQQSVDQAPYFTRLLPAPMHHEFIPWFACQGVGVDCYNTVHSIGRLQIEAACLSVPMVGASNVYAQKLLWPALTTEPCDAAAQRELVARVMTDKYFRESACAYAAENVTQYGYEARKAALLHHIERSSR